MHAPVIGVLRCAAARLGVPIQTDGTKSNMRFQVGFSCVLTILLLTGCFSPSLQIMTRNPSSVTVGDLVDHVACQIAETYDSHSADPIWPYLIEDNFVAQIDLTLMVTQTEGFNPSLNWISPRLGDGIIPSPISYAAMGGTMDTYNKALAVGVQYAGTQDRNVEQDYAIDLRGLWDAYRKTGKTSHDATQTVPDGHEKDPHFPYCMPRSPGAHFASLHSPLQGSMALPESIEDGLHAINESSTYNIYGTSGPTRFTDVLSGGGPLPGEHFAGVAAAQGGSGPAVAPASKTTFGSKVDFFITEGLNGGYNISLLKFKLAGGAGGGSGGGGGGGGGGGQILNYTRTTQDSLTVTFGATCSAPDEIPISATATLPTLVEMGSPTKGTSTVKFTEDVQKLAGWRPGMKIEAPNSYLYGTTIQSISHDGLSVVLNTNASSSDAGAFYESDRKPITITWGAEPLRGTTSQGSNMIISSAADTKGANLRAGMLILSSSLPKDTVVQTISADGNSFIVSNNANVTATQVFAILDRTASPRLTAAGTTPQPDPSGHVDLSVLLFPSDVRTRNWRAGLEVFGPSIDPGTHILSIAADGLSVSLSRPAKAPGSTEVTVLLSFEFRAALLNSLILHSHDFASGSIKMPEGGDANLVEVRSGPDILALGSVQWIGYALPNGKYIFRGTVYSSVTTQPIGQIWLEGNSATYDAGVPQLIPKVIVHFPTALVSKLNDDETTASYWRSVPPCDVLTAAQKQNAADSIGTQNQFQTFFRR